MNSGEKSTIWEKLSGMELINMFFQSLLFQGGNYEQYS